MDRFEIWEQVMRRSKRPRFCFGVLMTIASLADERGVAGPFVIFDGKTMSIRQAVSWSMNLHKRGRETDKKLLRQVQEEVAEKMGPEATGHEVAAASVKQALERARKGTANNVSLCVSELVDLGLVERWYADDRGDNAKRGAQRHAVYRIKPVVFEALGR